MPAADPSLMFVNLARGENDMSTAASAQSNARAGRFYIGMAAVCVAAPIFGFLPSFFAPLMQGEFVRPPVFYIHIALFFGWTVYFFAQAWLVANGRIMAHRDWGVLGAALAAAMAFSVPLVTITRLNEAGDEPVGVDAASDAWIDATGLTFFLSAIVLAFANMRRPQVHKRLMLLATIGILNAPLARWSPVLFPQYAQRTAQPFFVEQWPNLLVAGLMGVAAAFDRKTTGRISPVYLVGIPAYLILGLSWPLVGPSQAWLAAAEWIRHVAG